MLWIHSAAFRWHSSLFSLNAISAIPVCSHSSSDPDLPLALPPLGVSTSQTQQGYTSQVLQPEEALYLRKKKKRPILHDPYARFSALLYRRPPQEDQKAILASMDNIDLDHATLLWKPFRTRSHTRNRPHSKMPLAASHLEQTTLWIGLVCSFLSKMGNTTEFQHTDMLHLCP